MITNYDPQVSILIPWYNRPEIETTLPRNLSWFQAHRAEIVIINCGGDSRQIMKILTDLRVRGLRYIEIPRDRFNKCLAINMGAYFSRSPRLFVLDADIILKSDVLRDAFPVLEHRVFVTIRSVFESDPQPNWLSTIITEGVGGEFMTSIVRRFATEFSWKDGTRVIVETFRENVLENSRAGTGLVVFKKEHLLSIEGYNSDLELWGWEDCDVQLRLTQVLSLQHLEIGEALHLSHSNESRVVDGKSPNRTNLANLATLCKHYYSRGNFCGTYSSDICKWKDRVREVDLDSKPDA